MDERLEFFLLGVMFSTAVFYLMMRGILGNIKERSKRIGEVLRASDKTNQQQKISELKILYGAEIQRLVEEAERKQLREQVEELNERIK